MHVSLCYGTVLKQFFQYLFSEAFMNNQTLTSFHMVLWSIGQCWFTLLQKNCCGESLAFKTDCCLEPIANINPKKSKGGRLAFP